MREMSRGLLVSVSMRKSVYCWLWHEVPESRWWRFRDLQNLEAYVVITLRGFFFLFFRQIRFTIFTHCDDIYDLSTNLLRSALYIVDKSRVCKCTWIFPTYSFTKEKSCRLWEGIFLASNQELKQSFYFLKSNVTELQKLKLHLSVWNVGSLEFCLLNFHTQSFQWASVNSEWPITTISCSCRDQNSLKILHVLHLQRAPCVHTERRLRHLPVSLVNNVASQRRSQTVDINRYLISLRGVPRMRLASPRWTKPYRQNSHLPQPPAFRPLCR